MKSLNVFLLSFALLSILGVVVLAQEEVTTPAVVEAVNLDENIQAQDLEISESKLLPDSPFYFLKNWARGIQQIFTFNPVRKAELRMKFANEKLMEVKKMVELKKNPEIIKRATENYQQEIEKIKNQADKIKEKVRENPQVESFLDKFIHQQILHQKLLDRLETQVPPQAFEKIKEAREKHLERFKDVMLKLEDRHEKITEKLDEILEKQKGSEFKDFKNLEVLKNLEEKMPTEVKERIKKIQEKVLEKLYKDLEKMSPEDQERFKAYVEKISGDKLKHLEILGTFRGEELSEKLEEMIGKTEEKKLGQIEKWEITAEKAQEQIKKAEEEIAKAEEAAKKIDPEIYQGKAALRLLELAKEHLEKAKKAFGEGKYGQAFGLATVAYHQALAVERIAERIEWWKEHPGEWKEKFEELYPGVPLPKDVTKCKLPERPRCLKGRVTMERDKNGCPIFKCGEIEKPRIPQPPEMEIPKTIEKPKTPQIVCPMIWEPVCGVDGKTYSNECFAKLAGIEVDYKGVCKETVPAPSLPEQLPTLPKRLKK